MYCVKRFLSLLVLLALCQLAVTGSGTPAWADDDAASAAHRAREAFARDFAQAVISVLHDPKKSYGDRKDVLRRSFCDSVDIDWIAKFVLGNAWKGATGEQRARYMTLYRKYLTEPYVANFAENPDKGIYDIKIFSVNDAEDNDFIVHTQMQLMNQVNLKVDYRVYENDGSYKVRDIAIENVSLIVTHRAEFTALAGARGVDGVIRRLEQLLGQARPEMTLSMK